MKREKKSHQVKDQNYFLLEFVGHGISVEKRQLPLGDFIFTITPAFNNSQIFDNYANLEKTFIKQNKGKYPANFTENQLEMVFDIIIERKKASDFCSSLRDGRFEDQVCRLENSKFSRIIYLIEGKFEANMSKANFYFKLTQKILLWKKCLKNQLQNYTQTQEFGFISQIR
jgi:ERCC4-type nuclease